MKSREIQIRTLTPLWTGGVDRQCDRLHETGLIGSLRWWYEALIRGLGGYACDPTEDGRRCEYNPKKDLPPQKQMCPACYLFGCTGWARRFRLRVIGEEALDCVKIGFCSTLALNEKWLEDIFGGKEISALYGRFKMEIVGSGHDDEYVLNQLAWALKFASECGGLGAKLQHGFGQVVLDTDLSSMAVNAQENLRQRFAGLYQSPSNEALWPSRTSFFCKRYRIAEKHPLFRSIVNRRNLIGKDPENNRHRRFIPCVFDLRYKGAQINGMQIGFRQWLLNKRWSKQDISVLLGETKARTDEQRSASRLYIGMPWLDDRDGKYVIKVFGFVPPPLKVGQVSNEVKNYFESLIKSNAPAGGC